MSKYEYGDVYLVSLDPVLGSEQASYRPVLIISNEYYNTKSKLRLVIPISNSLKYREAPHWKTNPLIKEIEANDEVIGYLLCNQIKCIDIKYCNPKKITSLNHEYVDYIARIVKSIIGN